MKKIGVVLGGCGVYDGSEIHEAVITLLAIARNGAQAVCFAPDKPQRDVINHLTGEAMPEQRNVLARRNILAASPPRAANARWIPICGPWRWRCIRPASRLALCALPRRCYRRSLRFRCG